MKNGMFIVFEGVDGSGKSTMLDYVYNKLISRNIKVLKTREPGGTEVAMKIREIIVNEDKTKEPIDPIAQLLLFFAARIQHVKNVIIPEVEKGTVVLSDRYIDSTYVYQGLLNGLQPTIASLLEIDTLSYLKERPDHVLFFDVTPEISKSRIVGRGGMNSIDLDIIEKEELPTLLFRRHMLEMSAIKEHSKVHLIDGNKSIPDVEKQMDAVIDLIFN